MKIISYIKDDRPFKKIIPRKDALLLINKKNLTNYSEKALRDFLREHGADAIIDKVNQNICIYRR